MYIIDLSDFPELFSTLRERGYSIVGPTIRDGAIVFEPINTVEDLPKGWTDFQGASTYSLERGNNEAFFNFAIGPVSWKKFLFPPRVNLFNASRTGKGFEVMAPAAAIPDQGTKCAFLGIRPCELRAIEIQEKVFTQGEYVDPTYKAIREKTIIIVVNCIKPGGSCFCASMNTGPRARGGYDLALTEVMHGAEHYFTVETGSVVGESILEGIRHHDAGAEVEALVADVLDASAKAMGRVMETAGLQQLLYENFENSEWDAVSKRCLACANCTMVCPTCFCSTVEDSTDLTGTRAERWRRWDSCFTMDFAKVAGGNMRPSTRARYRQWMMHKLAYWHDQFGTSGCVGCGRCITWCPVGIDITAEVDAIRRNSSPVVATKQP